MRACKQSIQAMVYAARLLLQYLHSYHRKLTVQIFPLNVIGLGTPVAMLTELKVMSSPPGTSSTVLNLPSGQFWGLSSRAVLTFRRQKLKILSQSFAQAGKNDSQQKPSLSLCPLFWQVWALISRMYRASAIICIHVDQNNCI